MNVALVCFSLYILRDDARVGNERSRNMREREREREEKEKEKQRANTTTEWNNRYLSVMITVKYLY